MRILGIDPGMGRLGFAGMDIDKDLTLAGYGIIAHPVDPNAAFNAHLDAGVEQITNDFPKVINLVQPAMIFGETVPFGRLGSNDAFVTAALVTVKVIAFQFGIPYHNIAASTAKLEVTGDGRATKAKVRNAILPLYPQIEKRHLAMKKEQKAAGEKVVGLPQDVFDAVSIAITGAVKYGGYVRV